MAETEPFFLVNGKRYDLPTTFNLGEMCDAERYFGVDFSDAGSSGMRMAAAMLWIAIRRDDPTVTVDDIRALPPEVFSNVKADDVRPPALTGSDSSDNEPNGRSNSSGGPSEPASAPQDRVRKLSGVQP